MEEYQLPTFLKGIISEEYYRKWLFKKASSTVRRDRKRGNQTAETAEYRDAIHRAILDSKGKDTYTGEELNWGLLGCYDNEESKKEKRYYKRKFALLPTVDHTDDGLSTADFKICSWRTNDAKNDLALHEFIELCQRVVKFNPIN